MRICVDLRSGTGCNADNPNHATHCQRCGKTLRFSLQFHDPGDSIGDYYIISVIGYGAFGAVYKAQVAKMPHIKVALKEAFNPMSIRSYAEELKVLGNLQHPNLPRYFDTFEADDNGYLVMEFVPGQSLEDVLRRQRGPLAEPQVLGFAVQLCDVLGYLHQQTPVILHRDIKPANIRVTPAGLIKLVDFGLLKQGDEATRHSRRGLTPAYAPPEQWGDGQGTGPRSDIYSLGATLYHLLTGRKSITATERIAASPDPLPVPISINPEITQHVSEAVMKALALQQQERYPDAASMKQALISADRPSSEKPAARNPAITQPLDTLQLRATLTGHTSFVWSVAWSTDGQMLASGGSDQTVRIWDAQDGQVLRILDLHGFMNNVNSVSFSPDGEQVAGGGNDAQIWLWRVADGSIVAKLRAHSESVSSVSFSPDGRVLASAGNDAAIRLWRANDGSLIGALHGHTQGINSLAWSPDGQLLASGGGSGTIPLDRAIRLWRMSDRKLIRTFDGHTGNINSVAFSPDGRFLASAGSDRTVRLWRVDDGSLLHTLTTPDLNGVGGTVAFSPDGQTLVSGHWDNTIRLWRVSDGWPLCTLQEHTDYVKSVAWRPDGRMLASAGDDRTVRLWQA